MLLLLYQSYKYKRWTKDEVLCSKIINTRLKAIRLSCSRAALATQAVNTHRSARCVRASKLAPLHPQALLRNKIPFD